MKSGASRESARRLAERLAELGARSSIVPARGHDAVAEPVGEGGEGPKHGGRPSGEELSPGRAAGAAAASTEEGEPRGPGESAELGWGSLAEAAESGRLALASIDGSAPDSAAGPAVEGATGESARRDPFLPPDAALEPPDMDVADVAPGSLHASSAQPGSLHASSAQADSAQADSAQADSAPAAAAPGSGARDPFSPPDEALGSGDLEVAEPVGGRADPGGATGPPAGGSGSRQAEGAAPSVLRPGPAAAGDGRAENSVASPGSPRRGGGSAAPLPFPRRAYEALRSAVAAALESARKNFVAGVACAALAGLAAAHLVGTLAERGYEDSRERFRAAADAVDDREDWRRLGEKREEELSALRSRRNGVAATAGVTWIAVAGGVAFVWFRRADWSAASRRLRGDG